MDIQWKQEFELGIPDIDAQHQDILSCIGRLLESMASGEEEAVTHSVEDLRGMVARHFYFEESLMAKNAYPMRSLHLLEHQELLRKFSLQRCLDVCRNPEKMEDFKQWISQWLLGHTQKMDRKLAEWVLERS